ncbi:MAG: cytochrome C oxidase subunit II [Acidimicrobiia bacterium]|nr:cytochrome c oxidase subunit II [Acidimicrobiia bacterium]MBT8193063.1 cytochrome c oxidase subunit II [Acidimicrobiia bacterium]NNF87308.1 cytochrome C oxidase subunit II [Acidimicrobiia bacterium]NNL13835.1 cytochrome C oxidase subunit II [Acidimicrobiia bacterium]NNL98599.1 cytochrome C oxidase subunit II [Acidimicrobiia bacterium]
MSDQQVLGEEQPSFHADDYEKKWIGVSIVLLVAFAVTVAVAGFALGFQVPGDESRVDPRTVADSGPFSQPGLRDLGGGEYDAYILSQQYLFTPREIRVPAGSTVNFYITSIDVQHGFKLQDTNINMQIVPGQVSKLTATFDDPGEYPYICHEYCGIAHAAMFGSLIVEAGGGS